MYNTRKI